MLMQSLLERWAGVTPEIKKVNRPIVFGLIRLKVLTLNILGDADNTRQFPFGQENLLKVKGRSTF